MKLLTEAQRATLLDNGRRQAPVKGTEDEIDFAPVVKLFDPCGAATWLLTEIEPDEPVLFCEGFFACARGADAAADNGHDEQRNRKMRVRALRRWKIILQWGVN